MERHNNNSHKPPRTSAAQDVQASQNTWRHPNSHPHSSRSRYWTDVLGHPIPTPQTNLQIPSLLNAPPLTQPQNTGSIIQHTNNEAANSHRRFMCHICEKRFERKGHLESHIEAVHEGRRSHRCPLGCGKAFAHRSSLHRHMRTAHDRNVRDVNRTEWITKAQSPSQNSSKR